MIKPSDMSKRQLEVVVGRVYAILHQQYTNEYNDVQDFNNNTPGVGIDIDYRWVNKSPGLEFLDKVFKEEIEIPYENSNT